MDTFQIFVLVLGVLTIFCTAGRVDARSENLTCYSCVSQAGDNRCADDAESEDLPGGGMVECPGGWCTIRRQEHNDNPGVIVTFLRGCERIQPQFLDSVEKDSEQTFYFRSCCTDFCNNGTGYTSIPNRECGNESGAVAPTAILHNLSVLALVAFVSTRIVMTI